MRKLFFFIWVVFVLLLRTINNILSIKWVLSLNKYYDSMSPIPKLFTFITLIFLPLLLTELFFNINDKEGILMYVSLLSSFVFFRMVPVINDLLCNKRNRIKTSI